MQIANPIYDVVFKYLMEDKRAAKLIISSLTGLNIIDLDLKPTEYSFKDDVKGKYTVYRLDFAATIETETEERKLILIEIQKAKFATDIMRFRKYLGEQYSNANNSTIATSEVGKETRIADPIVSIYLLGHCLECPEIQRPVVKIKRSYIDAGSGEVIDAQDPFVEGLTHDSVIVQIPELAHKRRNKLEVLLSIFDQELISSEDGHCISFNENDYPEEFQFIIRRLLEANAEPELRKKMNIEDQVLWELESMERQIVAIGAKAEEAILAKVEAEAEKQQAEAEKQQAEAEKQSLAEKAIRGLVDNGYTPEQARAILGL